MVRLRVASRSDDYSLFDAEVRQGAALPPHVRAHHHVSLLVLAGDVEVACGETRHRLVARDAIGLPEDVPCRISALTDAHVLCLTIPAGLEALADLVSDLTVDFDDVAALLSAAGIRMLPPTWQPAG